MSDVKPDLHVSVWIGDLAAADKLMSSVKSVAEQRGGRDVLVRESEDGTELTVGFVLDHVDEEEARAIGHAVLGAVDAENYAWTVTVLEAFRSSLRDQRSCPIELDA